MRWKVEGGGWRVEVGSCNLKLTAHELELGRWKLELVAHEVELGTCSSRVVTCKFALPIPCSNTWFQKLDKQAGFHFQFQV